VPNNTRYKVQKKQVKCNRCAVTKKVTQPIGNKQVTTMNFVTDLQKHKAIYTGITTEKRKTPVY
jgi:hypothetical protein